MTFRSMLKKVKSWIVPLLKIAIAAGIISWFVVSGQLKFDELTFLLQPAILLVAFGILMLTIYLGSERWRGILYVQGFKMSSFETMKLTLIGAFFNFVIPGGVGGDVVKSIYIAKENPQARLKSVITIAMDRLLGLFSMLCMAVIVMAIEFHEVWGQTELRYIFKTLMIVFILFCIAWALVFSRRIHETQWAQRTLQKIPLGDKILPLYNAFSDYRHSKSSFFKAIFLSFLAQVTSVSFFIFIGQVMGYEKVSMTTYFFVVPIGFMINAIPITPAGVGVGQAAFFFLFNVALQEKTPLGTVSITAFQIVSFLVGLLGAVIYVSGNRKRVAVTQN